MDSITAEKLHISANASHVMEALLSMVDTMRLSGPIVWTNKLSVGTHSYTFISSYELSGTSLPRQHADAADQAIEQLGQADERSQ